MPPRNPEPLHHSNSARGFIGRGHELEEITTLLLQQARLITLIGPGGIGKTRLAAESVERLQRARRARVYWVQLTRLARDCGTEAIEEETARAVVDMDFSGRSARQALIETLNDRNRHEHPPVLVMDNCEHVLADAGRLIEALLAAVPGLSVLATSREPIGWVDEHLLAVPPLSRQEAVSLFRQRAELTGRPVIGTDEIAMAARICWHMDNNPLYVRLAAGRLARVPLAMLLEHSSAADDRRLRLSHRATLGVEERHHAIGDVISWSYDLCTAPERLLFDRMSVFATGHDSNPQEIDGAAADAGADLEAIEEICSGPATDTDQGLPPDQIADLLDRLVDRSLVSRRITSTTVRYSLLENLRVFAGRRLAERSTVTVDEPARLAERHRQYYRNKVNFAAANYYAPAEQDLLNWARAAWSNILTAIERSLSTPEEALVGLEICVGLLTLRLPFFQGSFREIRLWTERALTASRPVTPEPTELRSAALALLVWITLCQGQTDDAEQMLEECVRICVPDPEARRDWRRAPETDSGLPPLAEFAWGVELLMVRRDTAAIDVLWRAREKFDRLGESGSSAMSELFAALAASLLGSPEQADDLTARYLERATASGGSWMVSWAQLTLSIALAKYGDPVEATQLQRIALNHQLGTGDQWGGLWAVEFRAWSLAQIMTNMIAAGTVDRQRLVALAVETARILGGTSTLRTRLGVDITRLGPFGDATAQAVAVARKVLGNTEYEAIAAEGASLRTEGNEVQRLALGTLHVGRGPKNNSAEGASSGWRMLTGAEQDVALLAAAGWTNSAIAARRGKSRRTVDAQIATVLQKLEIVSRADITAFVPETQLEIIRAEAQRKPPR